MKTLITSVTNDKNYEKALTYSVAQFIKETPSNWSGSDSLQTLKDLYDEEITLEELPTAFNLPEQIKSAPNKVKMKFALLDLMNDIEVQTIHLVKFVNECT